MKYSFLIAALLLSILSFASVEDWGKTGHRTTGEIASHYLSKKTKRKIEKILDGKSLALVATFGDDIKSDNRYRKYSPWHFVNLDKEQTAYSAEKANPKGDLIYGIQKCVSVLEDKHASKEDQIFYLKMLIHFVGDLHQPLHAGRAEDKGGNDIQVRWFNKGTNIHRVWDSQMIDSFKMSYTELADNEADLSKKQIKAIAAGTPIDWMYESKALSDKIYASVDVGEKLSYRYMYVWFPVVREQLQKGGIRLAKVLNEIFD